MEHSMRDRILIIICMLFATAIAAAQGNVTNQRVLAEFAGGENWFLKGGDFNGTHYSPLSQINDGNVDKLGLAWAADLPIPDGISTTPIVVDGVIYLSGAYSVVFAVDASNGDVLWTYDPDVRSVFADKPNLSWISRVNRGVAVWNGDVFATTSDCRLISIDASSGEMNWTRQTCDNDQGYSISDSPYVGGGKVFVGNAGSESEINNRGYISAYNADSGELDWRFYIVPSHIAEENDTPALKMAAKTWSGDTLEKVGGGGNSWNEMTYDPISNQLFFGTSGSNRYAYTQRSPDGGDNLFLSSIVAINAKTGEYNWHYQTVDKDSWDFNATMNIVLADLNFEGEDRETVLIAPKNGFHYALDRHTGELLTAGKYAKVNWATHINMETGRPNYDPEAEYWNADEGTATLFWPNYWGAHSWNPMAFHPQLKLSYIPVVNLPSEVNNQGTGEDVVMFTEIDGVPHDPGRLVAFDPVTQSIRWSVNHALPYNGGIMATAGNLVFQGKAEGHFEAYAADTGEQLWSVQTGSAINAAPASYSLDGEQFVLIPIGAGGGLQFLYPEMHSTAESNGPTRLLAFSLDGQTDLPAPAAGYPALPAQPELDASPDTIATGKELYAGACKFCHGFEAVTRFGGTVPDLRYSTEETHATWHGIVIGGAKSANGMPAMEFGIEESEAIRSYVLSLSEEIRARQ
jgi:quinohemoprotein ethanol dehydrogenase